MTREEAIRLLSGLMFKGKLKEALDMAIKALEQEPTTKNNKVDCEHTDCNNCVNHKYCDYEPTTKNDLAHNLCDSCTNIGCEFQSGIVRTNCAFYMPPHIEPDNCGNYVVQAPTTKNDLGVDCISRQAVLDLINADWKYENLEIEINNLPSVTPQESRWIPVSERLPEYRTEVLTCSSGGYVEIQSLEYSYGGYWENQKGDWSDLDEIIAWMPLPQPYKAEVEPQESEG